MVNHTPDGLPHSVRHSHIGMDQLVGTVFTWSSGLVGLDLLLPHFRFLY